MKKNPILRLPYIASSIITCLAAGVLHAQTMPEAPGIHRLELEAHRGVVPDTVAMGDRTAMTMWSAPLRTTKRVFGYRPYWATADDYLRYDLDVLDAVAHFGAEVDSATGTLKTLRGWPNVAALPYLRERGVKTMLVAISFGYDANDRILGNPARRSTLVESLVSAVKSGGGHGVNVDFESVRGTQRANLVEFMRSLANRMRAEIPGAEISMALPAVDWSNAFDLAALSSICDYVILMGYDFHYSGSPSAGPVAPIAGETYNISRSVDTYLDAGVPPGKLLLGVPWYGYDWPVADSLRGSSTTGSGRSIFYKDAEPDAQVIGKRFDATTGSAWYVYPTHLGWRQVWYDDSTSLAMKYRLVREKNLGGIGIWALSYEGGRREIWAGIAQAFGGTVSAVETSREEEMRIELVDRELRVALRREGRVVIRCVDLLGRVAGIPFDGRLGAGAHRIALGGMASGRYFLMVSVDGAGSVRPLVVE